MRLSTLKSLLRNQEGVSLPFVGLAFFVLIVSIGAAVDYGRAQIVQSKMHAALDAAGLAAVSVANSQDVKEQVETFMTANLPQGYMNTKYTIDFVEQIDTGSEDETSYKMQATGFVDTTIMGIAGFDNIEVSAYTEVTQARRRGFEMAFVFDNTGSMSLMLDGVTRMDALKSGANLFLDVMYGKADSFDNMHIGVIPFYKLVKATTAITQRDTKPWVREDDALEIPALGDVGCIYPNTVSVPHTGRKLPSRDLIYSMTSTAPNIGLKPPALFLDVETLIDKALEDNAGEDIEGCVVGEVKPWTDPETGKSGTYTVKSCKTSTYALCPVEPMHPMMSSKAEIKTVIDKMTPWGSGTRVDLGAVWGWRLLSPEWRGHWKHKVAGLPLDYSTDSSDKIMIIFSDGKNCCSAFDEKTANDNFEKVCKSIKDKEILVYTILLHETDTTAIDLMRKCATEPNAPYFNYVKKGSGKKELENVFQRIADSLMNLRVSK